MSHRRHERFELLQRATWDYYTDGLGAQSGYIANISETGCLLKTFEIIENRRWVRMIITHDNSNVGFTLVGRVIRRENIIETFGQFATTLYRYGIEFTRPTRVSYEDLDLILALSSRSADVLPWRKQIPQPSFLPGSA